MADDDLIGGFHAVMAALETAPRTVVVVWMDMQRRDARARGLIDAARAHGVMVQRVPKAELAHFDLDVPHQGVVARVRAPAARSERDLPAFLRGLGTAPLLLVLDGVQDPHNLGACLRSAAAAGADAVILPKDKSAGLTATARKAASGAAERLPLFQITNLARALDVLKTHGLWVTGLAGDADSDLYTLDLRGPLALVMGAEGKGLRRLTREHCDRLARIPMGGAVDSLNVSVAAGIALFEAVRQRRVA